jgi:Leucine-rich repeat (LRR) protein/PKD repeat protein
MRRISILFIFIFYGQQVFLQDCRQTDSLALVAIYEATDGPNWTTTWDLNRPVDSWFGIQVNELGCVTHIDLDGNPDFRFNSNNGGGGNNLKNELPKTFGQFSSLTYLNLQQNSLLEGFLPEDILLLPKIEFISFLGNSLSGVVPNNLGDLKSLKILDFSGNNLTGEFPERLWSIDSIEFLALSNNSFEGQIPPSIGNGSELREVLVNNNNFSGSLPREFENLLNLEKVHINNNRINGSLPEINSESLQQFYFFDSAIEGCYPDSFKKYCGTPTQGQILGFFRQFMPWFGDFEMFCSNETQIGAPCSDVFQNTVNDRIRENCECLGDEIADDSCRERDSLALIDLYNSTDGPNWVIQWDTLVEIDNWHGISLNENECVTRIFLQFNGLEGTLPTSISNISELEDLTILSSVVPGDPNLRGQIPPELGDLINLKILALSQNSFEGIIPNDLSKLINLERLSLGFNNLTGPIPDFVGELDNLVSLALPGNSLQGCIPESIFNQDQLEFLSVSQNQLECELDFDFLRLRNLESLYLGSNDFFGQLPPSIGELTNLDFFSFDNNNFSGCIPDSYQNLCYFITDFYPENGTNCIEIPDCRFRDGGNPKLPWEGDFERFCNGDNQIGAPCDDGIEDTINDQINLDCECIGTLEEVVVINECRIRDSLALIDLFNSTNGPNWTIPWDTLQSIDQWFGITLNENGCVSKVNLVQNGLAGEIPTSIGVLSELIELDLLGASGLPESPLFQELTGRIPDELGDLTELELLNLAQNSLEGQIPETLSNLTNLQTLFLGPNNLTGSIPNTLGDLGELRILSFADNELEGCIPEELFNLTNLTTLNLRGNDLSCEIGFEFSRLINLNALVLNNNDFKGALPNEIGLLENLTFLRLEGNSFTGCFPESYVNLCYLTDTPVWEAVNTCDSLLGCQYDLRDNPGLPWGGDFERFCNNENQIGASCDDGDSVTIDDQIDQDCECTGLFEEANCDARPVIGPPNGDFVTLRRECLTAPFRVTSTQILCGETRVRVRNFTEQDSINTPFIWRVFDSIGSEIQTNNVNWTPSFVLPEGRFNVELNLFPNEICNASCGYTIIVEESLIPSFDFTDVAPCSGDPIQIQNTSVAPNEVSYIWDFGNGDGSTLENPGQIDYSTDGPFVLSLEIIDGECIYNSEQTIQYTAPVAAINIDPSTIGECVGNLILFDNDIPSEYSVLWDFGDGNISTDLVPEHSFSIASNFTVSAAVTAPNGCPAVSNNIQIQITAIPDAAFTISSNPISNPSQAVLFINETIQPNASFVWDFGDGNASTEFNPSHRYSDPGIYNVSLTSILGVCSDTLIQELIVLDESELIFPNAFTPDNPVSNNVLRFTNEDVITDSELWVYNRWGDEIFNQKNYTNDWDGGGYSGGVYFYVLKVGETVIKKTLTILR